MKKSIGIIIVVAIAAILIAIVAFNNSDKIYESSYEIKKFSSLEDMQNFIEESSKEIS